MSASSANSNLLPIISQPPASIAEVIQVMENLDGALSSSDGLKWFNLLYLKVTQQVEQNPPLGGWKSPAWLTRLDVIFANRYFKAIADSLTGQPVPDSWQALFKARQRTGVDRIQFALAGMNAHINHDLSLALLETNHELHPGFGRSTPEHQDYQHVNDLLEAVLPVALQFLATGLLGELAQDTGKIGTLLALWNIRAARDMAWNFAAFLEPLPGPARDFIVDGKDQLTGVLGQSLLVPIESSGKRT